MSNPIDWSKYPVRTCRTIHQCAICGTDITCGDTYRDGGFGIRAHTHCADELTESRKPVFRNCNVCGRQLMEYTEYEMGMCLVCSNE